jgi:pimeloyl-ACP methyl ester carboxylesterase
MAEGGRPVFVLIHGGATTGRFWDRLAPLLPGDVVAADLPHRGGPRDALEALTVDECVDAVVAQVPAGDGDVVVVAHSSGGLVAPGVARALAPRVRRIVLNAASVPPEGGSGLDCMRESHRERVVAAPTRITPGPPEDPEVLRRSYGEELDDGTLAFVVDPVRFVVDSMNVYFQPVSWAGLGSVPVTYVKNLRDRPVPPELQDAMAARLPQAELVEIDAGHIPAVTQPDVLARLLGG